MTDRSPVRVPCAGSGCPPAGGVLCAMCGHAGLIGDDGLVVDHERDDILAMIERGDFDPPTRTRRAR